jgi:hypothetical protein
MVDGYTRGGIPIPEYWVGEINRGKAFRKEKAFETKWADWRRYYRGEWKAGILPSNIFFKMMRTMVPRIYYRNPSVSLTPTRPGVENMVLTKLMERADNKLHDIMGTKGQMKRAVQQAIMFGTGGVRLGYGAEFSPTPDDLGTSEPDAGGSKFAHHVEYNDLVHPNMPWLMAAHPGSVIVPVGAPDIHAARWVCFETWRSAADLKADPRFRHTDSLGDGTHAGSGGMLLAKSSGQKSQPGVQLWEIRDKKTGMVFVMAPNANDQRSSQQKTLYCETDDLLYNKRLNYYPLIFNMDDEAFWGIPDSQIMEPQQIEKNEVRTQMMYHRRVALAKFLYETGSIAPDELAKLVDGNIFNGIQVKSINGVKEFNPPAIPPALLQMEADIDRETQEIIGLGVNQFGEYAPGSADRSATESQIVNQATQIRMDERRDACADLLTDVTSHINHIILEHWTGDIVLDVMGPEGVPIWIKFQAHELKDALYDIKIDPDTSIPQTRQLREQRAFALYAQLKQNPLIDPMQLTRYLTNEIDGVWADSLIKMQNTSPQNPAPLSAVIQSAGAGGPGGQGGGTPPQLPGT